MRLLRLGILISGRGSNMEAVARACRAKRIDATVGVVIADRESAGGLAVAQELGIETKVVPWKAFADRAAFEHGLSEQIEAHRVEVIVLAGFMRVLSPEFAEKYAGRLINIHPAYARPGARRAGCRARGQRSLRHGGTRRRAGRSAVEAQGAPQ
jgi:phosphoribosylglycinamide formyltransferase-1